MRNEVYGGCPVCVLCVCVCVCGVQAAHLRLTQLSDKLDILTDLVSCWLQNEFGVFRIMAFVLKIAIARAHGSRPFYTRNGLIFRILRS